MPREANETVATLYRQAEAEMEPDLKVQIEKLSPREGDVLIFKRPGCFTEAQHYLRQWELDRLMKDLKCYGLLLEEGGSAKLLDGEAMAVAANFLEGQAVLSEDWASRKFPSQARMAKAYRQTAKTIREWLIPKGENDGPTADI